MSFLLSFTTAPQYDTQRESPISHSIRNVRHLGNERPSGVGGGGTNTQSSGEAIQRGGSSEQHFKSPREILAASGSMEKVRIKNAENMLMDFFAL